MSSKDPHSPPDGDNKQASPQNSNQPITKKPAAYKLSIKGVRTNHTILPSFGRSRRGKVTTTTTTKKSKKIEIKVEDGSASSQAAPKENSPKSSNVKQSMLQTTMRWR